MRYTSGLSRIDGDGRYLKLTGGTLTGRLTIRINDGSPFVIDRPDGGDYEAITAWHAGAGSWALRSAVAEPRVRVISDTGTPLLTVRRDTGLLGAALVPLSLMRIDEQAAQNAGAVTVTGAATDIVSLPSMTVSAGDRIWVVGKVEMSKGATGGLSTIYALPSAGTATIVEGVDGLGFRESQNHPAASTNDWSIGSLWAVTVGGTLTLTLRGTSNGSDGTVAVGAGELRALVLRG